MSDTSPGQTKTVECPDLLSLNVLAELSGESYYSWRDRLNRDEIPKLDISGKDSKRPSWRVRRSDYEAWVAGKVIPATKLLSTEALARQTGETAETWRSRISRGEIEALDIRKEGSSRPNYRVTLEAYEKWVKGLKAVQQREAA